MFDFKIKNLSELLLKADNNTCTTLAISAFLTLNSHLLEPQLQRPCRAARMSLEPGLVELERGECRRAQGAPWQQKGSAQAECHRSELALPAVTAVTSVLGWEKSPVPLNCMLFSGNIINQEKPTQKQT